MIFHWLLAQGWTRQLDPEIYEYAEDFKHNNQFVDDDSLIVMFRDSRGVLEYRATGHVTPWED
jgi:hypothetical protein